MMIPVLQPSRKTIQPLNDCVVFRFLEPDKSAAGLHLATVETRKRAVVVAVGPGKLLPDGTRKAMSVKPGDVIVPWKEAASRIGQLEINDDGQPLCMVHDEDIAGLVVDDRVLVDPS